MLNKIVSRIAGWYTFRVKETCLPTFLNGLNERGVVFWGVRIQDGYGFVRVTLSDHARALSAAGGIAEEVTRIGLPFIIYKYRNRIGLLAGTILGLLLMFVSSLFVWDVRVTGNAVISSSRILAELKSHGVCVGTFIPGINAPQAGTKLLISMSELSSAYVNINGTIITVDVIERRFKPDITFDDGYNNVVASDDGVIVGVEAYSGKPVVSHGDVVTKGQTLICGSYLYGAETEILSNARGKVLAEVKKTFVYTVPLSFPCREYTGRTDVKTSYNVLGKNFDTFYGPPSAFGLFDADVKNERLSLLFLSLPVTKSTLTLREYRTSTVRLTRRDAEKQAEKAFLAWCVNDVDGELISKDSKYIYDPASDSVTIVGRVNVITDIAQSVPYDAEAES